MSSGEICARHYATRRPVWLRWQQGIITQLESAAEMPGVDLWLAPSMLDLQINGFAGVDFQKDHLTEAGLLDAVRSLQAAGCAQFLLTLVTDSWDNLIARVTHLRQLRRGSPLLESAIAGWHVEGPFLSSEPGYCGAHDPALMCDPTASHVRELRAVTGSDRVLLTLAPERAGALEAIEAAAACGMKISLGHTNASADALANAVRAGATGFTHLGNACPQNLDRHDNILWRVLDTPGLTISLICDGIHVSPQLFRLAHRALPEESIYYTTDAMAAAGAPPGRYTIGRLEVEVGSDQIVRQPGQTNFAGSALTPINAVFQAARMLRLPWQEVWDFISLQPARFMGLNCDLAVGNAANFCLLQLAGDQRLGELRVFVRGELCSSPA
jgi:N-acetylglucosamine-6-phosphate deacetylase